MLEWSAIYAEMNRAMLILLHVLIFQPYWYYTNLLIMKCLSSRRDTKLLYLKRQVDWNKSVNRLNGWLYDYLHTLQNLAYIRIYLFLIKPPFSHKANYIVGNTFQPIWWCPFEKIPLTKVSKRLIWNMTIQKSMGFIGNS